MYRDLDIAIQPRSNGSYPLTLHAPGGDARSVFHLPDDQEFQRLQARLAAFDTDEDVLTQIGRRLFAALFDEQGRDVLARTQGLLAEGEQLRLRISIDAEEGRIAALPWELLDDPNAGPLALRNIPIVRYLPLSARTPTIAAKLPLKVLLCGAPTAERDVAPVLNEVGTALETLGHHAQITVEARLTTQIFQRRLREGYHVWHFVGQGGTGDRNTDALLFSDGANGTKAVSASQLAVLLGGSGVRLVVLDASANARLATDPFRTIVPALIKTQVPTVVAMQFGASRDSSQAFAGEFYRALAEGLAIDACVTEGRRAVMSVVGIDRADWATPVVYSRAPDSQLIDVPRANIAGRIVTLESAAGLPANTSVSLHLEHGTLLNAGPHPEIERLEETPRPPRPVRGFLNRERELRAIAGELRPRQGAWVRGPLGSGITALLRQVANNPGTTGLPDGVVAMNSFHDPANADDAAQELFERFYRSNVPAKLSPNAARTYLGGLRALFVFDRLLLPNDELMALCDTLAEGSVLIAAEGRAPDTLLDVTLEAMPRQEATKLLGGEAGVEIDLTNVMFLDRICAAMGDLPMPLQLAGRLLRIQAVGLRQLMAVAEEMRSEPVPLVRAARLALSALTGPEQRVLAAVVRVGPAGAKTDALQAVSQVEAAQLDTILERLSDLRLIEGGSERYAPATRGLGRVLDRLLKQNDEQRRAAMFYASAALAHVGNLSWLAGEEANLVQAINTLLANNQASQAGALIKALHPAAVLHGKWGLWGELTTLASRAATASNDAALQAWALHEQGTRAGLLGDEAGAAKLLEARQLREARGDVAGAAASQHNSRYLGLLPAPAPLPTRGRPRINAIVPLGIAAVLVLAGLLWRGVGQAPPVPGTTPAASPTNALVVVAATLPAATETRATLPTDAPTGTPLPTPTVASSPTPEPPLCRVIAAQLNLRSGPGTNYQVLGVLVDGAEVIPLGRSEDGQWLNVQSAAGGGWVSSDAAFVVCNFNPVDLTVVASPPSPTPTLLPRPTARPTIRARPSPIPPTETPPATATPEPSPTPTFDIQLPPFIPPIEILPTPTIEPPVIQ